MGYISLASQTTLQNVANFFCFAIYDASAPGVLIESVTPAKPYGNPLQIAFTTNLTNGHIYDIKLWESSDGSPTGVIRNSMSRTVDGESVTVRFPEYLEVDITSGLVSGTTAFIDTSWVGWTGWIERVGQGTMIPDSAVGITDPQYTDEPTGGFTLIIPGDTFQPNEKFVKFFDAQVIVATPGMPSSFFGTGRIFTSNENFTSADKNKALIAQGAASTLTAGMPLLSTISDFVDLMHFFSNGGSHINLVINSNGSDKFQLNGDVSQIILGQTEKASFFKAFNYWWPLDDLVGVRMVGSLIYSYHNTYNSNAIRCAGQLLSRTEYPRLWAFVSSLSAGSVVTDTIWTSTFVNKDGNTYYTKKCCFSTGDGSTTFRLPLLTDMMLKGVDGIGRLSASTEIEQGIQHQHETSLGTLSMFGKSAYTRLVNHYSGIRSNNKTDLTSTPTLVGDGATTAERFGNKNLVDNAGAYCLIMY